VTGSRELNLKSVKVTLQNLTQITIPPQSTGLDNNVNTPEEIEKSQSMGLK